MTNPKLIEALHAEVEQRRAPIIQFLRDICAIPSMDSQIGPVGALAPGAFADIIMLDYHTYTPLTDGNYPWHLVFGMDGSHVTHTICGGQLLMKDRELLTLDEAAIVAHARQLAPAIWRRVQEL